MIGSLIVGALIGMMAGAITKKGESMGCVYNIFAGLVGSFVGQSLFGYWGPTLLIWQFYLLFWDYYRHCCS